MRFLGLIFLLFLGACKPDTTVQGREYTLNDESDLTITLGFDAHTNRYFGKAVNRYFGKYRISHSKITFTPPASTMKTGAEEDMLAEEKYFNRLEQVKAYRISDKNLTLILADGSSLHFIENQNTPFKKGDDDR